MQAFGEMQTFQNIIISEYPVPLSSLACHHVHLHHLRIFHHHLPHTAQEGLQQSEKFSPNLIKIIFSDKVNSSCCFYFHCGPHSVYHPGRKILSLSFMCLCISHNLFNKLLNPGVQLDLRVQQVHVVQGGEGGWKWSRFGECKNFIMKD